MYQSIMEVMNLLFYQDHQIFINVMVQAVFLLMMIINMKVIFIP